MKTISLFTLAAALLACYDTAFAHLGHGIVAGADGVYFLDSVGSIVWKVGPDGTLSKFASEIHGDHLVRDAVGNFYVEHMNKILWKISPTGKATNVGLGKTEEKVGGIDDLIAVDTKGNLYFANGNAFVHKEPKILKCTSDGKAEVLAGSNTGHADGKGAEARFTTLSAAVWGPEGALYITDGNRIRRVTLDGQVTTLALTGGFGKLLGITMDGTGNLAEVYKLSAQLKPRSSLVVGIVKA